MKNFFKFSRSYIFRGLIAIIPIALTYFAVQLLYNLIEKKLMGKIVQLLGVEVPGLGIVILLMLLYLLGFFASLMVGKRFFSIVEKVSNRIPIVKTVYQVGKQVSTALSLPGKQAFQRVVLVNYLMPGIWTVGFVTGTIVDKINNDTLLKVFIPTPPNPTSGTMVVVRESQTRDPGWTVEEAIRCVISGGIIGPSEIRK